jgi:ATP-dependent DNA ligase
VILISLGVISRRRLSSGGTSCGITALGCERSSELSFRNAACRQAFGRAGRQAGPSRRGVPLLRFVPPQLSQPVEKPPSGAQWLHEIKLDGYRMAARIDNGLAQLLTRTGLDWTYPSAIAALANLNVKTAYIDGELCGVDDGGLPSFAQTQAATDGERNVHLVYYAFELLHLADWDVSQFHSSSARRCLNP